MTIIIDKKEKADPILEAADDKRHLSYDAGDGDYSYDIHLECETGQTFRIERKGWFDYLESWIDETVDRQVAHVDAFIVEIDFEQLQDYMLSETDIDFDQKVQLFRNATKHLARLAMNMPVIITDSAEETVDILEYFEESGVDMDVRENFVTYEELSDRHLMLSTLSGINPTRLLEEGGTVGDALEERVDWDQIVEGLNLESWEEIAYIGPGTTENIREALQ